MKNALILHGTSASPDSNWFTWVKTELQAAGYQVWLPHRCINQTIAGAAQ